MSGINEYMMELVSEMVDPVEISLNEQIEQQIEDETNVICSMFEDEDELIEFIDKGAKIGYDHPIDFSDDNYEDVEDIDNDVDDIMDDDIWED